MNATDPQLALYGGKPAVTRAIAEWPLPDAAVQAALEACFHDGDWGRYHGGYSQRLQARLAALHSVEYVALVSSGTIAVELALHGVGVEPGDEVVLAGYDFSGNFRAIEALGARPVLVDIDAGSWCLNAAELERAIGPETRAILVSHLHGGLADMQTIQQFAAERDLVVVEDACQAPGGIVQGRPAGTWGDAGVLSFGGSKLLTAGRGGAVLTKSAAVMQRMKIRAERGNHGYPLSELQAAVLLPQLDRLAERNLQRRQAAQEFASLSGDLWQPLTCETPGEPVYYKVPWLLAPAWQAQRARVLAALQAEGVPVAEGFRGFVHRSKRRCRTVGSLARSGAAAEGTILLHHPALLGDAALLAELTAAFTKVARATQAGTLAND